MSSLYNSELLHPREAIEQAQRFAKLKKDASLDEKRFLCILLPKKLMISSMALEVFFVFISSFDSARIELIPEQSSLPADTLLSPRCHCVCRCELHLRNSVDSANARAYYVPAAFQRDPPPLVILRTRLFSLKFFSIPIENINWTQPRFCSPHTQLHTLRSSEGRFREAHQREIHSLLKIFQRDIFPATTTSLRVARCFQFPNVNIRRCILFNVWSDLATLFAAIETEIRRFMLVTFLRNAISGYKSTCSKEIKAQGTRKS